MLDADHEPSRVVPRTLWWHWHQRWRQAPDLVTRGAATWRAHNPTWEIRLLDAETIAETLTLPRPTRALAFAASRVLRRNAHLSAAEVRRRLGERVPEQPPAAPGAVDAALVLGVDHPAPPPPRSA